MVPRPNLNRFLIYYFRSILFDGLLQISPCGDDGQYYKGIKFGRCLCQPISLQDFNLQGEAKKLVSLS